MKNLDENQEYWFVLGSTSVNREMQICSEMRQENIECFLPMKYEVKRVKGLNEERLVPAIRGLIFVRGTEPRLTGYIQTANDRLYFRRSTLTDDSGHHDKLIVPDKEMEAFMEFVREVKQNVNFYKPEEITWVEGDAVRVTIGTKTYEGYIVRVKGKKQFSLQLKDSVFATVVLTPDLVQSIERTPEGRKKRAVRYADRDACKSKDIEADKRLLMSTARRLLFDIADRQYDSPREYQVTQRELERVMKRVAPYKGVTAALEGELSLCMFLGAMALQKDTGAATERLRTAIGKMTDTSMLKFRMRCYLAKLTGDKEEMKSITDTVERWNHRKLQRKQQEFLKEMGRFEEFKKQTGK